MDIGVRKVYVLLEGIFAPLQRVRAAAVGVDGAAAYAREGDVLPGAGKPADGHPKLVSQSLCVRGDTLRARYRRSWRLGRLCC